MCHGAWNFAGDRSAYKFILGALEVTKNGSLPSPDTGGTVEGVAMIASLFKRTRRPMMMFND